MTQATDDRVRGDYGIDEPRWPALNVATGLACLGGAALVRRRSQLALLPTVAGAIFLGTAASYLYTTTRGKFAVWRRLLHELELQGSETVLDMGCGRGAVLYMAAKLLPTGRALGIDLWREAEQSGNSAEVARNNAELEGVVDRVQLHTGDMRAMPFPDASVDLVLSSLAIHNIGDAQGRRKALGEAIRVLRRGGRLAVADLHYVTDEYARHLRACAMAGVQVRDLGWRFWYGGPWVATRLVTARKP